MFDYWCGSITLPIYLYSSNSNQLILEKFVYDTGASLTCISPKSLLELGYDLRKLEKSNDFIDSYGFNGARTKLYPIIIPVINISGFEIKNFSIYTSLDSNISNLLGTDILRYFNREVYSPVYNTDKESLVIRQGELYFTLISEYRQRFQDYENYCLQNNIKQQDRKMTICNLKDNNIQELHKF